MTRRCPSGSFTVLGDLAQATGAFIRDEWTELTQHLGGPSTTVETLRFCYRVPGAALDLAARQLLADVESMTHAVRESALGVPSKEASATPAGHRSSRSPCGR